MDALPVIMAAGMFGWMAYEMLRRGPAHRALIDQVASERGGTIVDGSLVLELDGIRLVVTAREPVRSGDIHKDGVLTWQATLPPPGTTAFTIYPEGFKSFATKVLGADGVQLGILQAFDVMYMIKAAEPALLRRLWTEDRCLELVMHLPRATMQADGRTLELTWTTEAPTPADALRGIDLVLALARTDVFGLAVLRSLPDAVPLASGEVGITGPGDIRLGIAQREGSSVTRVRAAVELDAGCELPDAIGAASLASDAGETRITFDTIVEDRARLVAAIDVLRRLAAGPREGVFR